MQELSDEEMQQLIKNSRVSVGKRSKVRSAIESVKRKILEVKIAESKQEAFDGQEIGEESVFALPQSDAKNTQSEMNGDEAQPENGNWIVVENVSRETAQLETKEAECLPDTSNSPVDVVADVASPINTQPDVINDKTLPDEQHFVDDVVPSSTADVVVVDAVSPQDTQLEMEADEPLPDEKNSPDDAVLGVASLQATQQGMNETKEDEHLLDETNFPCNFAADFAPLSMTQPETEDREALPTKKARTAVQTGAPLEAHEDEPVPDEQNSSDDVVVVDAVSPQETQLETKEEPVLDTTHSLDNVAAVDPMEQDAASPDEAR